MRRLGNPWAWLTVPAVVIACAVAGCGGGGSDTGSTSTAVQLHTPTAPNFPGADQFHTDGGATSTTQTQPGGLRPGQANVQRVLAPFQACLQDHGVPPFHFDPQHPQQPDPAQTRKRVEAQIACIPKLPPRLRQAAERLKRRYQQHQRSG